VSKIILQETSGDVKAAKVIADVSMLDGESSTIITARAATITPTAIRRPIELQRRSGRFGQGFG
jgi:hypothetical protein